MQKAIDAYFVEIEKKERPPTITGLANACKLYDRSSLIHYENRDEFFHTIKEAKARVHQWWEENLAMGAAAGTIFNLKNNFGWKDEQTHNINEQSDFVKRLALEKTQDSDG